MAAENMSIVPTQSINTNTNNNLTSRLLFQNNTNPLRFARGSTTPCASKPGFIDDKLFSIDHRESGYFSPELRRGGGGGFEEGRPRSTPSSREDDDEEDDDDDNDDDDDVDDDEEGVVKVGGGILKDHASLVGSSTRQLVIKDGGTIQPVDDVTHINTGENDQQGRAGMFQKMVTVAEHDGDMYYLQLLQGSEGSSQSQKDATGDSGCGFNGRKDSSVSSEPGESLRAIFSDPITGALMHDAMILPCGHSFGSGGIQQVIKLKACYTCSHPITEGSVAPNLSLRTAVQAFRREEDLLTHKAFKRRRERFEQDKSNYVDSSFSDSPRGRGVQFPFVVTDRVIIKGNKRTPQRFVGREAIVTTQCLNGWYVVKTLDNAESVKLQYRSLEKVPDNPSSKPMSDKMTPNWL